MSRSPSRKIPKKVSLEVVTCVLFVCFPPLSPEATRHQFVQRPSAFVALDLGKVERHALNAEKLFQVLDLEGGVAFHLGWRPAGFPLHFDPLVDVVAEQGAGRLPKVPYLAYLLDGVVAIESQNQFLTWPEMRDIPKKIFINQEQSVSVEQSV